MKSNQAARYRRQRCEQRTCAVCGSTNAPLTATRLELDDEAWEVVLCKADYEMVRTQFERWRAAKEKKPTS